MKVPVRGIRRFTCNASHLFLSAVMACAIVQSPFLNASPTCEISATGALTGTDSTESVVGTPAREGVLGMIHATRTLIVYPGIRNPIEIHTAEEGIQDVVLSVDPPHRLEEEDGEVFLIPARGMADVTVRATRPNPEGGNDPLASQWFLIKSLPDPVPRCNGLGPENGTIRKILLENTPAISAMMQNFDFDVRIKVKRFTVAISERGNLQTMASSSNMVTENMKAAFRARGRDSTVYFEDIIVVMPDGSERLLETLKFRVI